MDSPLFRAFLGLESGAVFGVCMRLPGRGLAGERLPRDSGQKIWAYEGWK